MNSSFIHGQHTDELGGTERLMSLSQIYTELNRSEQDIFFTMNETSFIMDFNPSLPEHAVENMSVSALPNVTTSSWWSVEYLAELEARLTVARFVVQRVLTPLVVVFGVVGNLVNIVVLTRRWMKSSTNCYLTALAVYDILYLVFALTMSFSHYPSIKSRASYIHYKYMFGKPLVDTCSNTGVWLTLTFTIERYIGVCHPMKGKRWCTPRRARLVILVVSLLAALITLPEFFEFHVSSTMTRSSEDNETRQVEVSKSSFGSQSYYSLGYIYTNQALFTFLPLVLLSVFNTLLVRAVLTAARQRRDMSKASLVNAATTTTRAGAGKRTTQRCQTDQQRITVMLITVVIVFLLCQLPQAVQKLYIVYRQETDQFYPHVKYISTITANVFNLLVMINASTNFILYSSFSTKFRRTFNRLFCGCRRQYLYSNATTRNTSLTEDSRSLLLRQMAHRGSTGQWFSVHNGEKVVLTQTDERRPSRHSQANWLDARHRKYSEVGRSGTSLL